MEDLTLPAGACWRVLARGRGWEMEDLNLPAL